MRIAEVIAVQKGLKARTTSEITTIHKMSQKADLFNGQVKVYSPVVEGGTQYPNENQVVQKRVSAVLEDAVRSYTERHDMTATLETSNSQAKADVTIDGQVIIKDAPVSLLLYLEKELDDWRKFVDTLPTLDPSVVWTLNPGDNLYHGESKKSSRTEKVQEPLVLYPATPEHPAQTQMITRDVVCGFWDTRRLSGAIPETQKRALVIRADKLRDAIKSAREQANATIATRVSVGESLFKYLLG